MYLTLCDAERREDLAAIAYNVQGMAIPGVGF